MGRRTGQVAEIVTSGTVAVTMPRQKFAARVETFGLDTPDPWALPALRLLFSSPRVYGPLAQAWELAHPGTSRALSRLVELGLANYQPGLIVDTRTGQPAQRPSRRVPRYRTTARGQRLVASVREDFRVLDDLFPRTDRANVDGVRQLLDAFDLRDSHAKYGLSTGHAAALCSLPLSNVKWWIRALRAKGYLRELPERYSDVREVIPEHWRVNRALCRQLTDVLDAFENAPQSLRAEFRLNRSRFLADIDPARVGISGATDFDHDVECQRLVGAMLGSPAAVTDGVFTIEPKFAIPTDQDARPWEFTKSGTHTVFYQPDAQLRERVHGRIVRALVEYERFQSRRDAWNHIERFLGYLSTSALPFEAAVLRFVVDSRPRERAYVALTEAFADYALDHPERIPPNPVVLAVSSSERLAEASDPLSDQVWFRVELPTPGADTAGRPVLHPAASSPYDQYFSRS